MQERRYPIAGRHPQSAGASVRVGDVPCDFILVAACNIQDLGAILSPLRSRIAGNGYEVLVAVSMPDTKENRTKVVQFVAQEIAIDGRIPPFRRDAVAAVIKEANRRAKDLDGIEEALTLRLRELGGLVRAAGDAAVLDHADHVDEAHITTALKRARTAEEQIKERYGSYFAGLARETSKAQRENSPYNYWESHISDDRRGYE